MTYNSPANHALWFKPQSLQERANAGAWTRGLMLYRSQKVLKLELEPMQDHWLLLGEVQGSQRDPYEVSIEMAIKPGGTLDYWDSECECPVGGQCKHAVALMLKAAYHGLALLGDLPAIDYANSRYTPPSAEQIEATRLESLARAQENLNLAAETQLLGWLQALDQANGQAPEAADGAYGSYSPRGSDRPEQFLYLLSVASPHSATPKLQLEVVVAYPKVTGGWSKPKSVKSAPYAGQAVYDLASDADHQVLQLMRAMPDSNRFSYNFNATALPSGQAGLIALQLAASTGRLFLNDGKGYAGLPVQWGPAQPLRWDWQESTSAHSGEASWLLRAKLADSNARLCLNSPPLDLDATLGLCGPVLAEGVSDSQLAVLLKAPALKPAALQKHQLALAQRLGSLPLPPVLQALTPLNGISPTPCLHLSLALPGDAPLVGLIAAQLQFDYAGHRGWWAGRGNAVMIERADGRFLLQRDAEAEFDAITQLFDLGLRAGEGGLFVLAPTESQQTWLVWADTDFSVLREAGFTITLDAKLANWITHADTLDVQLQPQDDDEGATSPLIN